MENRKELILKEIVDQYIQSGEPVSSQMLLEKYDLSYSSATVRNDMHRLEEEGYIKKPYTSGGRIPTLQGYRYFVDWLIELSELTTEERQEIVNAYSYDRQDGKKLLRITVMMLANITGNASFVLAPKLEEAILENFTLVKFDSAHLMAIIVTEWGIVESTIISLEKEIAPREIDKISSLLNKKLKGKKLKDMRNIGEINLDATGWYDKMVRDSLVLFKQFIGDQPERDLMIEGTLNLLEKTNTRTEEDFNQLKRALAVIHDRTKILELLNDCPEQDRELNAIVGIDDKDDVLQYSLITKQLANCSGILGVLGPLQMDYSKTFSVVQYIGSRLNALLRVGRPQDSNQG